MTAGQLLIGIVLAVGVPAATLYASAPGRHAIDLTAAPFATPRLLVAHLATAVPLGLLLTVWLNRRGGNIGPVVRVGLAAILTGGGVLIAHGLGPALVGTGFAAHAVARTLLAVGLVTPWLFVAAGGEPFPLHRWHWAVGGLVALLPPAMYADRLMDSQTRTFTEYRETGRFVRARAVLNALDDLGAELPSPGLTRADARKQLDRDVARLSAAVQFPLGPASPPAARLGRGFALIQLDRLTEAEVVLAPLAESDPAAALVLAAVYRDQERWDDAETLSRQAIARLGPGDRDLLATAYDGWAQAARGDGRPADAEIALREALDRLPDRAAHYRLQLGRHYHDGGRPAAALENLNEAVRLDPGGTGKSAQDTIAQIRRMTPACVLK